MPHHFWLLLPVACESPILLNAFPHSLQMWEMVTALPLYVGMKASQIRAAVRDGGLRPEFPAYIMNIEYK